MRAKLVFPVLALSFLTTCLTSCIVGVGDWERYNKDFHYSYPLKSGGRLTVETFNGSVEVSGWDQETVDISGTKYGPSQVEADDLKVNVDTSPDSVSIRVPRPSLRRNNQGARFVIKVPRNTNLSRISTSNSSIRTQDGSGPARLRTSNGSIRVEDLRGNLDAETSNSGIDLLGVEGDVSAHTSNSHIHAERVNGSLEAVTSNSGVQAYISRADRPVRIETSNSGVELTLPPRFSGGVRVSTNNGGITLRLPESIDARVVARTSNASITTDFELKTQGEISRNHLDGVIGAGGQLIDLSTSNSSIRLLRR
jgi:DUF4097 and DUF4098 domain-containing protein YvlB